MKLLITGAAGYIGSHVLAAFMKCGHEVVGIDDLSSNLACNISTLQSLFKFDFIKINLNQKDKLEEIFAKYRFDGVAHFAAFTKVAKSLELPLKYYQNNVSCTLNLLQCVKKYKVKYFLFSSTAAIYAPSQRLFLSEDAPKNPASVYGQTKLICEQIIQDFAKSVKKSDFKYAILRYFNVAGYADLGLRSFKKGTNPTLLLSILASVARGDSPCAYVFGSDYPTPDGSALRDFIHVWDLSLLHTKILHHLPRSDSLILNLGYGKAYSVLEAINAMQAASATSFDVKLRPRRRGDIGAVAADISRIKALFDFTPKYDDLRLICNSVYQNEKE